MSIFSDMRALPRPDQPDRPRTAPTFQMLLFFLLLAAGAAAFIALQIYYAGAALQRAAANAPPAAAVAMCAQAGMACAAACACGMCGEVCIPAVTRTPAAVPRACAHLNATWTGPTEACAQRATWALLGASYGIAAAVVVGIVVAFIVGFVVVTLAREPASGPREASATELGTSGAAGGATCVDERIGLLRATNG